MKWEEISKVTEINNKALDEKFNECSDYVVKVLSQLPYYKDETIGIVWTRHEEYIKENIFLIYIDRGNMRITHRFYNFEECGIEPLINVPYPH